MHCNPCFNLFILHDNSFDNQGSRMNKNAFLCFDIISFTIKLPDDRRDITKYVASLAILAHYLSILYHVVSCLKASHNKQY